MSRIQIILAEPAQTDAYKALKKQGHDLLRDEFVGPDFADAKYKFNGMGFEVHVDKTVYVYPAHTIARIKITPTEEVCAAT